jgi:polar amino acid transport system substrate-binding protein
LICPRKENTMLRWIGLLLGCLFWQCAQAEELRVSFNLDKPPFTFRDASGQPGGIEVDVMRLALKRAGYGMQVNPISRVRLVWSVKAGQADVAASVPSKDDGAVFYSDTLFEYANVVISRKARGLTIKRLEDLDHITFVIWQRGWGDLGSVFEAKYKPDEHGQFRPNYFEGRTQEVQVRAYLAKRADAIVIDRTIFAWYMHELAPDTGAGDELVFHNVFKNSTTYAAVFASKTVRDRFNVALKSLHADGSYQAILKKYK